MTGEQLKKLSKMKKLINEGYRKFQTRNDRDYLQDLLDIGITEEYAWSEILLLSLHDYIHDYKPFFSKGKSDGLTFKKKINGYLIYIKLTIEEYNNNEETVCWSFHIDHK